MITTNRLLYNLDKSNIEFHDTLTKYIQDNTKAKEVVYNGKETVWQFGNSFVGIWYLKIEYRRSDVVIYGWISSLTAREQELTGFANRQIVSKAMKVIENIRGILTTNCGSKATAQNSSGTVDSLWNEGVKYYQSDKFELVLDRFIKAAELGSAPAQYQAGYMYMIGRGTATDYTKTIYWLTKSASQNFASTYNSLGICFVNGYGVTKDLYKALECYQKAAALGHENARNSAEEVKRYLESHPEICRH